MGPVGNNEYSCMGGKNEFWVWEAKMNFGTRRQKLIFGLVGNNEFWDWEAKMRGEINISRQLSVFKPVGNH